jgi:hypothetical protein
MEWERCWMCVGSLYSLDVTGLNEFSELRRSLHTVV